MRVVVRGARRQKIGYADWVDLLRELEVRIGAVVMGTNNEGSVPMLRDPAVPMGGESLDMEGVSCVAEPLLDAGQDGLPSLA